MSFGWSVGDIAQAIIIVTKIVKALDSADGAPAHYCEAVSFLTNLKRTLEPLKTFERTGLDPVDAAEISEQVGKIQFALEVFLERVGKYQSSLGSDTKPGRHRYVTNKLKWRFVESGAVDMLRKGVESHMSVLNSLLLRLTLQTVLECRDILKEPLSSQAPGVGDDDIFASEDNFQTDEGRKKKLSQQNVESDLQEALAVLPPQINLEGYRNASRQQYDAILARIEEQGMSLEALLQSLKPQTTNIPISRVSILSEKLLQASSVDSMSMEALADTKDTPLTNTMNDEGYNARAMYNIPQSTIDRFVGREKLLDNISSKLESADGSNRLALYGLGGNGKSCIVLEFALRLHRKTPGTWIFWLNGTTESSFIHDYEGIAEHAKLVSTAISPAARLSAIQEWLDSRQSGKWLMIVDNVDDATLLGGNKPLIDTIPRNLSGSVIVTTRNKQIATKVTSAWRIIHVPALDHYEGLTLLEDFMGTSVVADNDSISAGDLLSLLEYQPLAIRCAGSFMCMHSMSISTYLELYNASEQEKLRLLNSETSSCAQPPSMPGGIILTFMISFDQIKSKDSLAADLLSFMGCVANRDIRRDLLPSENAVIGTSRFEMARAIGLLKAHSLFTADIQDTCFHMHSLVHLGVRHWLRQNGCFEYWIREALLSLSRMFPPKPDIELGNMTSCDIYLPHVESLFNCEEISKGDLSIRCSLAHRMSRYFQIRGRPEEAEKFAKIAADLCCGDCLDMCVKLEAYASILRDNGKCSEALKIERRVLEDRLNMLGDSHEDVLCSRNNIALSIQGSGDYTQAEEMHRFVLSQRRLTLGHNHPDIMSSLNNMAYVLQQQKKYSEAERFAEEAVKAKTGAYGRNHASTLQSMSSLAIVLQERGEVDRALVIHEKVLQGRELMLGKNHPHVLRTIANMIGISVQQGLLEKSERMARDVLGRLSQTRGADHPELLIMQHNLAWILFKLGRLKESETLARKTLGSRKSVLGNGHPLTKSTQELLDDLLELDEERVAPKSAG